MFHKVLAIAQLIAWTIYGYVRVEMRILRIIWSLWHHARKTGLTMVAGASTAVLVFGIVWAGGGEEPSRNP